MPTFREALRTKIIDKGQRLVKYIESITRPRFDFLSDRRQNLLIALRKSQNLTSFTQPKTFNLSDYQSRTTKYFSSLIKGISKFIRDKLDRSSVNMGMGQPGAMTFKRALNDLIERSEKRMTDLARLLIDRQLTPSQFRDSLQREIRELHLGATLIGVRGAGNLTSNVIELTQARTSKQLNFLNDFIQDVQDLFDKQQNLLPAQSESVVRSVSRYASSAKAVASDAERQFLIDSFGDKEDNERLMAYRVLSSKENHCDVCPELSGRWIDATGDEFVPIGSTPCRSECGCYYIFSRASDLGPLPQETESSVN